MALSAILADLQSRLDYRFDNEKLLVQALTHSSHAASQEQHNERLEFLGDRVLALIIAEALFENFPAASEGEMAVRLNTMVRKQSCADVAVNLQLGQAMAAVAGKKAPNRDIFTSKNVLGDVCEAVLAAVYLDGGLEPVRKLILQQWGDMIATRDSASKDPKSALQEWALGRGLPVPDYREISRTGPDHAPEFVMQVSVVNNGKKTGSASSKREAEQRAAEQLLKQLTKKS